METKIDTKHLEKVAALGLSWHSKWDKKLQQHYVKATKTIGTDENGKRKQITVHLHAVILDSAGGVHIDHINHDTLDNTEINLLENGADKNTKNRNGANKNSSTGIRNVIWDKRKLKYVVQLQISKRNTVIGEFDDIHEAEECAIINREKYYITR